MSDLAVAVERALGAEHPHVILSVDQEAVEGVEHLSVIGVDYARTGPELTTLCVDLFEGARTLSHLPVTVSVQGMGDAGRRLDPELESLTSYIDKEYGVDAVVVFAWEHGGPELGELQAVTDDPIQTAILSEMLNKPPS